MIGLRPYQTIAFLSALALLSILHLAWIHNSRSRDFETRVDDLDRLAPSHEKVPWSDIEDVPPDHSDLSENTVNQKYELEEDYDIPPAVLTQSDFPLSQTEDSQFVSRPISQVLVVARQHVQNVDWIKEELPDLPTAIYTVDDENAQLQVPSNKGHEAMVYLTYIIDHYDSLSNVTIFAHNHRQAWHNNDVLLSQMPTQLKRLQSDHVLRQGYFNIRCHLKPGCPAWIELNATDEDVNKVEQNVFAKIWNELFLDIEMPSALSQPCCSQFAASQEKIRSVPLERWIHYRNWLLQTDLDDIVSGRIFEYTWQLILTGEPTYCPSMQDCYCKGFGVCFASNELLQDWLDIRDEKWKIEKEMNEDPNARLKSGKMREQVDSLQELLGARFQTAVQRGDKLREQEAQFMSLP